MNTVSADEVTSERDWEVINKTMTELESSSAASSARQYRTFWYGNKALYIGGEAFYLTVFYFWKCSLWLICRPWYILPYFGFNYYIPPIHRVRRKHIVYAGKKIWGSCNRTNMKKCAKVVLLTPYLPIKIVFLYPSWMNNLLVKQADYWRYLVAKNISQCLGVLKFFKFQQTQNQHSKPGYLGSFLRGYSAQDNAIEPHQIHRLNLYTSEEFKLLSTHNKKFVLFSRLPLRTISRWWGQISNLPHFPDWFRVTGFRFYIWLYSCDFHEAQQQDLRKYKTLGDFFRRSLRPGLRPIHGTFPLVSPADGTVLHCGEICDGILEQVKGVTYSLSSFLGPLPTVSQVFQSTKYVTCFENMLSSSNFKSKQYSVNNNPHIPRSKSDSSVKELNRMNECINTLYEEELVYNRGNKLFYCVIYLAPGDYHRFHSPADWVVYGRRHFKGKLFSVRPSIASWLQGLFCVNERALYVGKWKYGFFSCTPVGALNVGSINVGFDKDLKTNVGDNKPMGAFQDETFTNKKRKGIPLRKGQLMGDFNMGSTLVLLFEAPAGFKLHTKAGQTVKYGQGIGHKPPKKK